MSYYVKFDESLVEAARKIGDKIRKTDYKAFLMVAVGTLEGDELFLSTVDWSSFGSKQDKRMLMKLAHTAGAMMWELSKAAPTDVESAKAILSSVKLGDEALVSAFAACFQENRRRLLELKNSLSIESNRFKSLDWRLDLEVGRRGFAALAQPDFQMKLTLESPSAVVGDVHENRLFHMSADLANFRRLHDGLASALDELDRTHCQRVIRYIT